MAAGWREVDGETLAETSIFSVRRSTRVPSAGGKAHDFFVIAAPDWVNVVALTDSHEVLLVEQFRQGTSHITLEVPGGMLDPGEDAVAAGLRELREETGYEAAAWRVIGVVEPNPATFTNRCTTLLATGCRQVAVPQFDRTEDCTLRLARAEALPGLVRSGAISHALVVAALAHAWLDGALPANR